MKINGILKRAALLIGMLCATVGFALGGVACGNSGGNSSSEAGVAIVLNSKALSLDVDETYTLTVAVTGTQEGVGCGGRYNADLCRYRL